MSSLWNSSSNVGLQYVAGAVVASALNRWPVVGDIRGQRAAEDAFRETFEQYAPRVRQYIARRVAPSDVDDVLEDVFVVLWRKRDSVQWDEGLEWWLLRTAYRCVGGAYRTKRRRDALIDRLRSQADRSEDPDDARRELVQHAMLELGERDREVLRLDVWDELSARDAARVLGVSPAAYEKRLQRAKQRFRTAFEHLSESGLCRTLSERREP